MRIDFLRLIVLVALVSLANATSACSRVPYPPQELLSNREISFVKGHVRWNDRPDDVLVFVVEQAFRGTYPSGEYRLVEGGAWGNMCEYDEMPVTYPRSVVPQPEDGTVYLPVIKMHDGILVTFFGWSRGIGIEDGYVTSRSYGVRMPADAFEARLQRGFRLGLKSWSKIPDGSPTRSVE